MQLEFFIIFDSTGSTGSEFEKDVSLKARLIPRRMPMLDRRCRDDDPLQVGQGWKTLGGIGGLLIGPLLFLI